MQDETFTFTALTVIQYPNFQYQIALCYVMNDVTQLQEFWLMVLKSMKSEYPPLIVNRYFVLLPLISYTTVVRGRN